MPLPFDLFQHTSPPEALAAWMAAQPEGTRDDAVQRLAQALACSRSFVWNLIGGDRKVRPEQVAALARVLALSEEEREYLRRVVAVQNAAPEELAEARLSMWELQARHTDVPASEIAALQAQETTPEASERALVPVLNLLDGLGADADARALGRLLVLPPFPDRVAAAVALVEQGAVGGERLSPRLLRVSAPRMPDDPETVAWQGIEDLARDHLLGLPAEERDYLLILCSADDGATRQIEAAHRALEAKLLALARAHERGPVGRLYAVLAHHLTISQILSPPDEAIRPVPATAPDALTPAPDREYIQEGAGDLTPPPAPGRPCLYHHLTLASYARAWVTWQRTRRRPLSLAWLARRAGLSRSHMHALCTGVAPPQLAQVAALARAFDLDADEARFLEGVILLTRATDREEQWRLQHSLLLFAAERGYRTLEGEQFRACATWAPMAILALSDLRAFRTNPAWISVALHGQITWREAQELVRVLLGAGLLAPRPGGPPKPAVAVMNIEERLRGLATFSVHFSALGLQRSALLFPSRDPRHSGWVLALPDEAAPALREILAQHRARLVAIYTEMMQCAATGGRAPDRVTLLSHQLFPLSHPLSASLVLRRRRT